MNNRRETFRRRRGGDGVKELWVTARRERRSEEHITLFTHIRIIIILYSSYYNSRQRLSLSASERQREIVGRSGGGGNLILINVYSKRRR